MKATNQKRSFNPARWWPLAALGLLAPGAVSQPPAPRGNDAVAVINEARTGAKGTFPIAAPSTMPLKQTAYPVPAGALFVSPGGKASNPGILRNAPTTLEAALQRAPEGGTIVFSGGTYRVGGLILARRLTLQAAPDESPWLKGSSLVEGWVRDGNAWRHDNWKAQFPPRGYLATVLDKVTDPRYPMAPFGDMVFVDGRALFQVGARQQVGPGTFYVDYAAQKLYLGSDPSGKSVEAATVERAFTLVKNNTSDASGSRVRGLGFAHYQLRVGVYAPKVVVEDCAFVWNATTGLIFGPAASDGLVQGNTFTANGSSGMAAQKASRLRVERNLISYNNVEGFKRTWTAAGIKVIRFEGFVCRDNIVEHNFATGIWMDVNLNKAVVTGNTSRFNSAIGIFFEISSDAIIAFNVAHDNGAGVQISNAHNARIYNNTLVNNNRNLVIQQGARKNDLKETVANTPADELFTARNNVVKNNLLWNSRPKAKDALFDFTVHGQSPERRRAALLVTALDHNASHRVEGDQPASIIRWAADGNEPVGYDTMEAFAGATGYGKESLSTTGDDPYFANAAKGNFRLKPNSPAQNKGEALPPDVAEASGKPSAPGSIGAF